LTANNAIIARINRSRSSSDGLAGEIEGASCHGNLLSAARCVHLAMNLVFAPDRVIPASLIIIVA
jgi:hypothetical protein